MFHFCTDYTNVARVAFTILPPHSSVHLLHALNWLTPLYCCIPGIFQCKLNKIHGFPLLALKSFLVAYTLSKHRKLVPGHLSQVPQRSPHHRALQLISAEKHVIAE